MSLVEHAEREMRRAGLFNAEADYGGATADAVMELVKVFAAQGHSGGSAWVTLGVLEKVLRFDVLTPITSEPSEWMDVSEQSGRPMWQNIRKPSIFSKDGGQTWYDIDAPSPTP